MATTLYDKFAEEEVARGRPLVGLFRGAGEEEKRDLSGFKLAVQLLLSVSPGSFEAWKKRRACAP